MNECENPRCDNQVDEIYTIPLDEDWDLVSGTFCSLGCARLVNRVWVAPDRPRCDQADRDRWMRQKYTQKNPKKSVNLR